MAKQPHEKRNKQILARMRKIPDLIPNQDLMNKIGLNYDTMVKSRTQRGVDVHGRKFVPYSKPYAKKRKRENEPTHIVNLTMDHGSGMLQKLNYRVEANYQSVEAYISDPQKAKIGYYHAVSGAGTSHVIREWWGLSEKQEDKITKIITTKLDEIFKANL